MPRINPIIAALERDRERLQTQLQLVQNELAQTELNLKRFSAMIKKKPAKAKAAVVEAQPELSTVTS